MGKVCIVVERVRLRLSFAAKAQKAEGTLRVVEAALTFFITGHVVGVECLVKFVEEASGLELARDPQGVVRQENRAEDSRKLRVKVSLTDAEDSGSRCHRQVHSRCSTGLKDFALGRALIGRLQTQLAVELNEDVKQAAQTFVDGGPSLGCVVKHLANFAACGPLLLARLVKASLHSLTNFKFQSLS